MALSNTPRSMPRQILGKKNTDVAIISKGMAVKLDTAADDGVLKTTAVTDKTLGVAMSDIAVGGWGDIQVTGLAVCLAGGSVTRGDRVTGDAASKVATTTTDKNNLLGIANRSAALNELFEVELGIGGTLSV